MKALFMKNKNRENQPQIVIKRMPNYEQKVALVFAEKLSLKRVTAKIRRELD